MSTTPRAPSSPYLPYLAPGTYRLSVEASGFKQFVRTGIDVRTGETPRVDVQLEVSALSERVEVTGAAPLLATETSFSGQILSVDELIKISVSQKTTQR